MIVEFQAILYEDFRIVKNKPSCDHCRVVDSAAQKRDIKVAA